MKLLIIVNVDWFLCSHRLPVALGALRYGFDVHIATTFTSHENRSLLSRYGFILHELRVDRSGKSILSFAQNFFTIYSICRKIKPDLVHLVTIQPVLIGGLAAKLAGVQRVVFAISGLGHVFIADSFFSRFRRLIVEFFYICSLSFKNRAVIFQNPDDQSRLSKLCSLGADEMHLIPGSGVDLNRFVFSPITSDPPVVLFASRLLKTKGVREFVDAAKVLKDKGLFVRFLLAGNPDLLNPASISVENLDAWQEQGIIEYLGHCDDLPNLMSLAHIVCLPSYYPEGLPKVLCEASASGRVIVTTDQPGCRDAIENYITGILVPPKDSVALANALEFLLSSPSLVRSMGFSGRKRAERLFDVDLIVQRHLDIYSDMLSLG